MIKVLLFSFASLFLIILTRQINKEFSFILSIAASVILFSLVIADFKQIIDQILSLSNEINGLNPYVSLMLKILGVSVITQFVVDLCRDSGENALATQTELASKIIILIMVMPLFEAMLNIVIGLLKWKDFC